MVEVEAYRIAGGATAVRRGCGVLITRKGHVFVPLPVIQGADALIITFSDGLRSPVRRLAEDGHNQLALVKALVLPEHPAPLTLSEQEYPGSGSRLTLLNPGEPLLSTGSGVRADPASNGADRAFAVPVPAGCRPDGGALMDGRGELAGLVLGSTASADGSADRRLLVLPAAEIRNSVERILHGNPGTLLERLADAPTL